MIWKMDVALVVIVLLIGVVSYTLGRIGDKVTARKGKQ